MKKVLTIIIGLILCFSLVGCSSDNSTASKSKGIIKSEEEFTKMYSSPNNYKNYDVDFYAKVFIQPEKDDKGTYLQVYAYNKDSFNTLVAINQNLDIKESDIVHIKGRVDGAFEGENMMGGKIVAPRIIATSIEKTDYATAFSPAKETKEVSQTKDQHGYSLTVNKIEFADNETRAYVTIENKSKNKIFFSDMDIKLIQGSTQIKSSDSYESNYPKIDYEIMPGVKQEGVIVFDKADHSTPLKLYFEGHSDDYTLDFSPFEFEIK